MKLIALSSVQFSMIAIINMLYTLHACNNMTPHGKLFRIASHIYALTNQ